jgi:hypothetical protein
MNFRAVLNEIKCVDFADVRRSCGNGLFGRSFDQDRNVITVAAR